ncbi:MAG: radical SAM protein [bacterium]
MSSKWELGGSNVKLMARSIPYYILGAAGHAPDPKIAKLDITYKCHLRCQMCFYWSQNTCTKTENIIKASGEELSFTDIEQCLIPQLNDVDLEYFSISGGEPLVRGDIYDILSLCGQQEFRTSLNSNLYRVGKDEAKQLVDSGVFNIQSSLHGTPEIHDFIVRKKGSFDNIVNAIRYIQDYKRKTQAGCPRLTICCVISKHNQYNLVQTLNLVKELEVDTLFFHFIEWQNKQSLKDCDRKSRAEMTEQEILQVDAGILMSQIEEIMSISKSLKTKVFFHPLDYPFTKEQLEQWHHDPEFSQVKKCFYLWMETRIDPYGWVLPCYYIDQPMGNIKMQELKDIWNCGSYRDLRKQISNGLLPMCYKCCKLSRQWQNFLFHI